ncbi:MAG: hypothetical protein P8012_00180 [Desulfobacterales bacterium]
MATRAQQFEFLLAGVNDPDIPGAPLALGTVKFFEVGTTTAKDVWTESAKTNDYTEYTLDANGVAELYGDGSYKIELYDSGGSLEYTFDEVKCTASTYNRRVVSTSPITVTPDDDIIFINTGSGNITLNLQDIALFSKPVTLKKISASNTATYDAYSTQTIDGDLTGTLTANNDTVTLVPDTDSGQWRKTNHLATGLVGLTATVAELNQLDGNVLSRDGSTTIIDTGSSSFEHGLDVVHPNLPNSGVSVLVLGAAVTAKNAGVLSFTNIGTDSASNRVGLGIYGVNNDILAVDGSENVGIGGASDGAKFKVTGTGEYTDTLTLSKVAGDGLVVAAGIDFGWISNGATKAEINKAADGIGVTIPRQKVIAIGDWNMNTTESVNVAHGLDVDKIVGFRVLIINDAGTQCFQIPYASYGDDNVETAVYINGANVFMGRELTGKFDSTDYEATSYNRGWVIVDYID